MIDKIQASTFAGMQTFELDPPLECETGDVILWSDRRIEVRDKDGRLKDERNL